MSIQTVEVQDGQDIVLVQNGEVVGYIVNKTRELDKGNKEYSFTGHSIQTRNDNYYSFSIGSGVQAPSIKLDDFLKAIED